MSGPERRQVQVSAALHRLRIVAGKHNRTLSGNNKKVYDSLRYGVPVKIEAGKATATSTSSTGTSRS